MKTNQRIQEFNQFRDLTKTEVSSKMPETQDDRSGNERITERLQNFVLDPANAAHEVSAVQGILAQLAEPTQENDKDRTTDSNTDQEYQFEIISCDPNTKMDLPLYYGDKKKDTVSIMKFISNFEKAAAQHGLNTSAMKAANFGVYLRGTALGMYHCMDTFDIEFRNWTNVKGYFIKYFMCQATPARRHRRKRTRAREVARVHPESQVLAEKDDCELKEFELEPEGILEINALRGETGRQPFKRISDEQIKRNLKAQCYFCHRVGHIQKFCYQRKLRQQSENKDCQNEEPEQTLRTNELIASLNEQSLNC